MVIPIEYCTGVGAVTSGIANPLTWVQIPVRAPSVKERSQRKITRSLDIQWLVRQSVE